MTINPPMRNGKPDWRTWTVALFMPKLRQQKNTNGVAFLIGDNNENLEAAKAAISASDRKDLDAAIAEQYRRVEAAA